VLLAACGSSNKLGTPSPLVITTASLAQSSVDAAYTGTVTAKGGTQPYFFNTSIGTFPPGITMLANGQISGTPTTPGVYAFTVLVYDSSYPQLSTSAQFTVSALGFTPMTLTSGAIGTAYTQALTPAGGTAPYSFAITAGALPAGLVLTSAGTISGTPTAAQTANFTVTVTDSTQPARTASEPLTLTIVNPPVTITTSTLPPGTIGSPYSAPVMAAYGTPPYTFALASGSGALPAGLSLSAAGVISGTPTVYGKFPISVQVTDSSGGAPAMANFTLQINPTPLVFSGSTLANGTVGSEYSATLTASGGNTPYSYAVTNGSLPSGLTLSTGGVISGTPTATGTSTFTVTVTDSTVPAGQTTSASFTITVGAAPLTINTALPTAGLGTAYSDQIGITGGVPPYTVTVTSTGSLPPGIMLSNSGLLSGTPTAVGSYTFDVQVTDSNTTPASATATLTLQVVNSLVQVNPGTVLTTVPEEAYGVHTSVYDAELDDTGQLPALLQTGGISTLRYPGGIYADVYHWAQYSITPFDASTSPACNSASNGYMAGDTNFADFVKVLQATSTQAIITINYGSSVSNSTASKTTGDYGIVDCSQPNTFGQPEEAAAWVAYANGDPSSTQAIGVDAAGFDWQTVGYWAGIRAATPISPDDGYNFLRIGQSTPVGIQYWELGNEIFYNGYEGQGSETDLHAPYIYPNGYSGNYDSRTGVAALSPTAYGTNAIAFITAMRAVDPNIKIGLVLSSPNVDPIPATWNPAAISAVCAGTTFDFGIFHYYPGTYTAATAQQLFTLPQQDMPNLVTTATSQIKQSCTNGSTVQFFVTETNDNFGLATGTPTQVVGLYAAHEYLSAFEAGIANVDWLELHNSYLTSSEAPQPAYYGIELAHLLAAPGDSMVQSTSSSSGVVVHAAQKANGQTGVFLLNTNASSSITVQVSVGGSNSVAGNAAEYSYGTATTQSGAALTSTSIPVTGNSLIVTVPPYTEVGLILP
jgi:hypothetical protein